MTDFTWLDYIIFLIFFVATILGLARGLFRELISLVVILVALVVMVKFTMPLTSFLYFTKGSHDVIAFISRFIYGEWGRYISLFTLSLSVLLLFVGTMSIGEAVNHYVFPNTFMSSTLSFIYRITGGLVGLIRGYIFNVIFIMLLAISPISQEQAWTQSYFVSRLSNQVKQLGDRIAPGGFGKFADAESYQRK